jgi:FAD/FMN-containing dehydrogenase
MFSIMMFICGGGDAADVAAQRETLPAWTLVMAVGGRALFPEDRLTVAEKDISEAVAASGAQLLSAIPGLATSRVEAAIFGLYDGAVAGDGAAHWKLRAKGGVADILFHTPLDKAPGYLATMLDAALALKYPPAEVGVYLQPQHQGVAYHMEFSLPYAKDDNHDAAKARALFSSASKRLIDDGAYFSRPYGEWADPVYNRDAAGRDALRTVKKIVDPNNVLNPSKLCF